MINSLPWSCDNPRVIVNRRYAKMPQDLRNRFTTNVDYYLSVPCGRCALCKERIAKEWKVRLTIECQNTETHIHQGRELPRILFITFTLAPQYYDDENEDIFASWLVKFRDNYRKRFGKSPRYFAITDRGSQYGRLHLHMLLFNPRVWSKSEKKYVRNITNTELHNLHYWYYFGIVDSQWVRNPNVSQYVCGYITGSNMYNEEPVKHGKPICDKSLRYKPKIYPSKGLGSAWLTEQNMQRVYINDECTLNLNGFRYALPRYYQSKIWTSDELFERRLLRQTELNDYYLRNGLDPTKWLYRYKDTFRTYLQLQVLKQLREKFTQLEKPHFVSTPITENEFFFSQAELDEDREFLYYFHNRLTEEEYPY